MSSTRRRRAFLWPVTVVLVVLLAGGLYWFQPWRLWTNTVVDDQLPTVAAEVVAVSTLSPTVVVVTPAPAPSSRKSSPKSSPASPKSSPATPKSTPATPKSTPATTSAAAAVLLASGTLISHEHETSGVAELIRLTNGHRVLALKGLRTSDGPALHVWLTDTPVLPGSDGWHIFDDGHHLDLGRLKGNIGNQLYPVPDDAALQDYSSVTIWCERFSVSFGAAELVAQQ